MKSKEWEAKLQLLAKLGLAEGEDYFTGVGLVTSPLNESEAKVYLVLIETSLLFLCKFQLISIKTVSLT